MKVKAFIVIGLLSVLLCGLCGCGRQEVKIQDKAQSSPSYMVTLSHEYLGDIICDTRTGVEYWRSCASYNCGVLTVLVDKDGKPLIYEGGHQ